MSEFKHISAEQAQAKLQEGAALVDIRDEPTFRQAHIEGALHIDNGNVGTFISGADKSTPLIVCCYHGFSSQNAAQYFCQEGFTEVYSLDGGFEGWRNSLPFVS